MNNRKRRAEIAGETIRILDQGGYSVGGVSVSIDHELASMRAGTVTYSPTELDTALNSMDQSYNAKTQIEVINQTTFYAAKSLIDRGYENPLCLNFASAKNPGGGFQGGSQAQEECLARASGLHQSLSLDMTYYEKNRRCKSSFYTNYLIYSPVVPVFRDDSDELLTKPYVLSIITSPAVNAGAVRKNEPDSASRVESVMMHRIRSLLMVAIEHEHKSIVLGAWGCGVFRNEPSQIANWFKEVLINDSRFTGAFENVVFAVLDNTSGILNYKSFEDAFVE